jgi:hypothetical protein
VAWVGQAFYRAVPAVENLKIPGMNAVLLEGQQPFAFRKIKGDLEGSGIIPVGFFYPTGLVRKKPVGPEVAAEYPVCPGMGAGVGL